MRPFGSASLSGRLHALVVALAVSVTAAGLARAQGVALPSFNVGIDATSVSGLSSGGYMAVQFDVAFSSSVKGAGIVAGGPYLCARGDQSTATSVCSCVFGFCPSVGAIDTPGLIRATDQNAGRGAIDPTANLAEHRVWLFSGTADTVWCRSE